MIAAETPSRWNRMGQGFEQAPGEYVPPTEEPPQGPTLDIPPENGPLPLEEAPTNGNGGVLELAKKNPMLTIAAIFLLARMARII